MDTQHLSQEYNCCYRQQLTSARIWNQGQKLWSGKHFFFLLFGSVFFFPLFFFQKKDEKCNQILYFFNLVTNPLFEFSHSQLEGNITFFFLALFFVNIMAIDNKNDRKDILMGIINWPSICRYQRYYPPMVHHVQIIDIRDITHDGPSFANQSSQTTKNNQS